MKCPMGADRPGNATAHAPPGSPGHTDCAQCPSAREDPLGPRYAILGSTGDQRRLGTTRRLRTRDIIKTSLSSVSALSLKYRGTRELSEALIGIMGCGIYRPVFLSIIPPPLGGHKKGLSPSGS